MLDPQFVSQLLQDAIADAAVTGLNALSLSQAELRTAQKSLDLLTQKGVPDYESEAVA